MFHVIKTIEAKVLFSLSIVILFILYGPISFYDHHITMSIVLGIWKNLALMETISATLTGFFITALSIFIVFPDNQKIRMIKSAGHYEDIPGFLFLSATLFFLLLIASLISILSGLYTYVYSGILLFLLISSLFSSIISILIIGYLLDYAYN